MKTYGVKLRMYDEFTGKCFAILIVSVEAEHQYAARKIAKSQYDYVLRGSPSFTFDNPNR